MWPLYTSNAINIIVEFYREFYQVESGALLNLCPFSFNWTPKSIQMAIMRKVIPTTTNRSRISRHLQIAVVPIWLDLEPNICPYSTNVDDNTRSEHEKVTRDSPLRRACGETCSFLCHHGKQLPSISDADECSFARRYTTLEEKVNGQFT